MPKIYTDPLPPVSRALSERLMSTTSSLAAHLDHLLLVITFHLEAYLLGQSKTRAWPEIAPFLGFDLVFSFCFFQSLCSLSEGTFFIDRLLINFYFPFWGILRFLKACWTEDLT